MAYVKYFSVEYFSDQDKRREIMGKVMDKLWIDADKRSRELYDNLYAQGKLNRDWDNNFSFGKGYTMYYSYYRGRGIDTPYRQLIANLDKENGRSIYHDVHDNFWCSPTPHIWTLEQDQQYIKLKEELERCDEINVEYEDDRNLGEATRLAKQLGFEDLSRRCIGQCLDEVLKIKRIMKYFENEREFCLRLLDDDVEKGLRTDYHKFVLEMHEKYKFSHLGSIHDLLRFVDEITCVEEITNSVKSPEAGPEPKCRKMKSLHQKIERKIDYCFNTEQAKQLEAQSKDTKLHSVYIKLKLKLAEEIGLITMNNATGLYEEIYGDIMKDPIDELKIKYYAE